MQEGDDESELPCVVLEFDSQFFVLFGDAEGVDPEDVMFRGKRNVFGATVADFIKSLKGSFEISKDITLEFPQLELSIPQDLAHSRVSPSFSPPIPISSFSSSFPPFLPLFLLFFHFFFFLTS